MWDVWLVSTRRPIATISPFEAFVDVVRILTDSLMRLVARGVGRGQATQLWSATVAEGSGVRLVQQRARLVRVM